jgi:transposase InsO family protein
MPWKEYSAMDQKKEFIILSKTKEFTIRELCLMFGISRTTAYKYLDRYARQGYKGLEEQSKRPKNHPNRTGKEIEEGIIALREEHPRWGAGVLLEILKRTGKFKNLPSAVTVNKILKENGLIKERRKRKRVEPQKPIFDPQSPNEVWSADFKGKFRLKNGEYCYPLTIADSYSRYIFTAKGLRAANGKYAKPVFIKVFRKYGLPQQLHTDNGAPFGSMKALGRLTRFSVWLLDIGVQPVFSDPGHPEQNGRHERMHRELKGEATRPPGKNLQGQQIKLNKFVREYNEVRPYQVLGMRTAAKVHEQSERRYPEKVEEWNYPKEYKTRYVCRNGNIRVGNAKWIFVSMALRGKNVGLEEFGEGIYRLYYRHYFLGYLSEKDLRVYDNLEYTYKLHV